MANNHTFENKNRYRDFDLSFSQSPLTNDLAKKTDANAITQSVKNLLYTSYYERPFRPTVGSNLRKILFEPADFITMAELRSGIEEVITNYEPRINIIDIDIEDRAEMNAYGVTILYNIVNTTFARKINLTLKRLR